MQIPLLLLLVDFFIQLFAYGRPMGLEYMLPVRNATALIKTIYLSTFKWKHFAEVIMVDLLVLIIGCRKCIKLFAEENKND
jgi:hypothetical protein